jgi:hypothetical protein
MEPKIVSISPNKNNRLRHSGYSLVITTSDYRLDSELEQARILLERGIEALVLVGDEHDAKFYRLVADQEVPYINTYVYKPEQKIRSSSDRWPVLPVLLTLGAPPASNTLPSPERPDFSSTETGALLLT